MLLSHLERQHEAMRSLDARTVEAASAAQEACRRKIVQIDARRRAAVRALSPATPATGPRLAATAATPEPSLRQLIAARPDLAPLGPVADELRSVALACAGRAKSVSRLASGLLGHLNTAVRLLAGDGRYARDGTGVLRPAESKLRMTA